MWRFDPGPETDAEIVTEEPVKITDPEPKSEDPKPSDKVPDVAPNEDPQSKEGSTIKSTIGGVVEKAAGWIEAVKSSLSI